MSTFILTPPEAIAPPEVYVGNRMQHNMSESGPFRSVSITSLSISKNAECPPIARCSEYFDNILVSFSSCMLVELHVLEYTVKNQKIALNFQTDDAI